MITGSPNSRSGDLSLVEQKRLQWQKEREELERIDSEMFSQSTKYERTSIKTYFSNVNLTNTAQYESPIPRQSGHHQQQQHPMNGYMSGSGTPFPTHHPQNIPQTGRTMRSPSLPPILREKFYNYPNSQALIINPDSGYRNETSPLIHNGTGGPVQVWTNDDDGRGSNKTITLRTRSQNIARTDDGVVGSGFGEPPIVQHLHHPQMTPEFNSLGTPNSFSSGQTFSTMSQSMPGGGEVQQQRKKWNYSPQPYFDPMTRSLDSRSSSQNVPYWLEKGLNEMRDSEEESVRSSHIRGQNIPVDPNIMAERAGRRRKAMELQNAIKEQLMEQEKLKQWEKEKQFQEEMQAEEKLRKQIETERQRLQEEKRMQEEKIANERRKADIMRLAVEKAEKEAQLERERRKKRHIPVAEEEREEEPHVSDDSRFRTSPRKELEEKQNPPSMEIINPIPISTPLPPEITNKSSEIDGIALVLQSITPIVPLTNLAQPLPQDLLGTSVNNLQFALLLAQQQQQLNLQARQLNTISSASSIISNATNDPPLTVRESAKGKEVNDERTLKKVDEGEKECVYCCKFHGGSQTTKKKMPENFQEEPVREPVHEIENQLETVDISDEKEDSIIEIPKEADEVKEETLILDKNTCTQTDKENSGNELVAWDHPRILTPRKYRVSSAGPKSLLSTTEIGVQTDLLSLDDCKICLHKKLVLQEISQVTVTQTSSRKKELSPIRRNILENGNEEQGLTTTTITTTTTIRAKANERGNGKKESRPKWGVNQPTNQFVKASDRYPVRRRRKGGHLMKSFSDKEDTYHQRKKADSGVSSNNGSMHSMDVFEDIDRDLNQSNRRRNMCTEILPISTDGNGQVFVNYQEARLVKRGELTRSPSQGNIGRDRIMDKRSEDLPFIPGVFRTEKRLMKSDADSNYLPSPLSTSPLSSKDDNDDVYLSK